MSNPVFNQRFLSSERVLDSEPMTVNGTINKSFILFGVLVASSAFVWSLYNQGFTDKVGMLMTGGFIISIIAFFVAMFNRKAVAIASLIYAGAEGLIIGGISSTFEKMYPGIVMQAVRMTLVTLFVLLALYRTGVIKCTDKFRSIIFTSTLAIAGAYFISIITSLFGMHQSIFFSASPVGIGVSIFITIIAALNLINDFDFIERGAQQLLDKSFEWYGAFGLMVTLVWLYLEILRLLGNTRNR